MNNVNSLREITKSFDKETKKRYNKLRKYVIPHHEGYVFGTPFVFMVVVCFYLAFLEGNPSYLLASLVFVAIAALGFYSGISGTRKYRSCIAQRMTYDGVNTLLSDFENGGKAFKGSMILGQQNIYGKRSGEIIPYSSVVRIYQYIEKDGIFENDRKLCLELKGGKKVKMGNIPLKGKGNEELKQVFGYICSKNENVMLGYAG